MVRNVEAGVLKESMVGVMEFESGRANSPWTTLGIVRVSKRAHETVPVVEGGGLRRGAKGTLLRTERNALI